MSLRSNTLGLIYATVFVLLDGRPSFGLSPSEELTQQHTGVATEYCQSDIFQPRCLMNDVILMRSATYGRMRIGDCITAEEVAAQGPIALEDPRYLGCSIDVLNALDRKCSGRKECHVRVADVSPRKNKPCFPGLNVHLEAAYDCISIADVGRTCSVVGKKSPSHIIGWSAGPRICGTKVQPWIVEAPTGQKVSITLLDFTSPFLHPDSPEQSKTSCQSYGLIVDKIRNQNASICGELHQREKEIYLSAGNMVQIFFDQHHREIFNDSNQFLLRIQAVGCSDIIPPEDAWLKRSGDMLHVGCYSSRQTWQLNCRAGIWHGVLGNCTVGAFIRDSEVEPEQTSEATLTKSGQVLAIVAIGGFTLAICLTIVCIGAICLRRFYSESKKKQEYKTLNYRNTSSSRVHNVNQMNRFANDVHASFAEHQQQQQQQQQQHQMPTMYSVYVGDSECSNGDDLINITDDQSSSAARL